MQEMARQKNVKILCYPEHLIGKSLIEYQCNIHGTINKTQLRRFLSPETKPKCCANAAKIVDYSTVLKEKADRLGHVLISYDNRGARGLVRFFCPKHGQYSAFMLAEVYIRNDFGLLCCANAAKVKEGNEGLTFSQRRRSYPSYRAQDYPHRMWASEVNSNPSYRLSVFSGPPNDPNKKPMYHAHHLFSQHEYKELRLNVLNGFTLERSLHGKFHTWVNRKYNNNKGVAYKLYSCKDLYLFFIDLIEKKNIDFNSDDKKYEIFGFVYTSKSIREAISHLKERCELISPIFEQLLEDRKEAQ